MPSNAKIMVYLGGVGPTNALEEAIAAIAKVPEIYFVIAGWTTPKFERVLINAAEKFGVSDRVRLFGVVRDEKWDLLESCDIAYCVYQPTHLRMRYNATASNKLMEAIAAGLPVIAANHADFRRLILKYDIGVYSPNTEVKNLEAALKELLADEGAFKQKSQNARRCFEREFNFEFQFANVLAEVKALTHVDWVKVESVQVDSVYGREAGEGGVRKVA